MTKVFRRLLEVIAGGALLTILFWIAYQRTGTDIYMTLHITFLTTTYHFLMRVVVGEAVTFFYDKREFDYTFFWWKQHSFEAKLYQFLKVKKWKLHMITARPEQFDMRVRTMEEIIHNMTQAELVHEIIILLSFVPLKFIKWYGAAPVFIISSIAAALIDSIFVIIQRFNRPRMMKLLKKVHR